MLWTIFVILLVLWALGMVTSYTLGGVHPSLACGCRRRDSDSNYSGAKPRLDP